MTRIGCALELANKQVPMAAGTKRRRISAKNNQQTRLPKDGKIDKEAQERKFYKLGAKNKGEYMYVEWAEANGNVKILLANSDNNRFFRLIRISPTLKTNKPFCSDVNY